MSDYNGFAKYSGYYRGIINTIETKVYSDRYNTRYIIKADGFVQMNFSENEISHTKRNLRNKIVNSDEFIFNRNL